MCFASILRNYKQKSSKYKNRTFSFIAAGVVCQQTFAQQRTISRLVISAEDHEPLIGATISVQETKRMG